MKPITHFSASQLKLIKQCPLRWYYYHEGADMADTDRSAMHCGIKVHESIEASVNGYEFPDLSDEIDKHMKAHYDRCVENYKTLDIPTGGQAEVEWEADTGGVALKGRVDYVVGNRIYDWKTGRPRADDYVQSAVYQHLARANGISDPKVIFVHLSTGEIRFMPRVPDETAEALVCSAMTVIKAKAFMPRYGAWCSGCPYAPKCEVDYP